MGLMKYKMNTENLFEFEECEKGYILKKYLLGDDPSVTEIVIPSEYEGKPVTSIGEKAFWGAKYLQEVKIAEGIGEIGNDAFFSCENLKTVLLPHSLKVISNGLFTNCVELENIELPDGLKEIEAFAFCNCALRTIKLPAGLEKIGTRAFSWCKKLEKVDFGDASPLMDLGIFGKSPKLSAENVIQGLTRSVNTVKPFRKDFLSKWNTESWDSVLREDVFVLALKNNNFDLFDKEKLLRKILEKKRFSLFSFLPQMENADWQFSREFIDELILELDQPSCVEYRAWLLDYKRRKYGFDEV